MTLCLDLLFMMPTMETHMSGNCRNFTGPYWKVVLNAGGSRSHPSNY